MVHRGHIAARGSVSRAGRRCDVILLVDFLDKSGVHHLSNVIHFGNVWPLFRIENETSSDQMTKLKRGISMENREGFQGFTS